MDRRLDLVNGLYSVLSLTNNVDLRSDGLDLIREDRSRDRFIVHNDCSDTGVLSLALIQSVGLVISQVHWQLLRSQRVDSVDLRGANRGWRSYPSARLRIVAGARTSRWPRQ